MDDIKLYSVLEAAKLLNLKVSRIRSAIFKREVEIIKIGRLVRIPHSSIVSWIESGGKK